MSTKFGTGVVSGKDGLKVGQEAAEIAFQKIGKKKPNLAVLFSSSSYDYSSVIQGVKKVIGEETPIVGCSSAGEFTDEKVTKGGVACALIASDSYRFFSGIGENVKENPLQAIEKAMKNFPITNPKHPYHSAMLFVDGLAGQGEETVLAASSLLGPTVKFSGGAAGDDLNFKKTHVFSNNIALSNAISMCFVESQKPVIISVKHGHKPLSPPLKVTKAKDNILYEIEGKPALEAWKHYLKNQAKELGIDLEKTQDPQEISKVLLKHEAGLMTSPYDYKLRFPTSANPDGSLNFVCTITEGSVIKIMDSKDHDQIASAREAAEKAMEAAKGTKLAGAIIFDCACRSLLLKDKFSQAVEEIKKTLGNIPLIGFETYGEIAMEIGQMSGFHNTTTVIMLMPE